VHRDIKADNILLHYPSVDDEALKAEGKTDFDIEEIKFNML